MDTVGTPIPIDLSKNGMEMPPPMIVHPKNHLHGIARRTENAPH